MAGTRDRSKYGHTSGLDIDRLRAELTRPGWTEAGNRQAAPRPAAVGSASEPARPGLDPDRYLSKGGDPNLSKGTRRVIRRTEARRAARGDS